MDEVLTRMSKVIKGLVVFPGNMERNLGLTRGAIFAEAIIAELVKGGMGRQEAHEVLRESSMRAFSEKRNLKEILLKNKKVLEYLNKNELDKIMDYQNYLGLSIEKTKKLLKNGSHFSNQSPLKIKISGESQGYL